MINKANTTLSALVDAVNSRLRKISPAQGFGLSGQIDFHLAKADGTEQDWSLKNLIMDAGEDAVALLLKGTGDPFDYIAIGTTNTAADDAQTTLVAEIASNGGSRDQDGTPSTSANVYTASVKFTFTGILAIVEVGLFNAAAAGDMLARQIFSVINVDDADELTVTWNITVGIAR